MRRGLIGVVVTLVAVAVAAAGALASPATSARVRHLTNFKSPSSNIGCYLLDGTARCDIERRRWSPPPRPRSCPNIVDFGQGLIVGRSGRGRLVCAGDTALNPQARILPYGATDVVGSLACQSAVSGVTCTNRRTRHGFFISRQRYRLF